MTPQWELTNSFCIVGAKPKLQIYLDYVSVMNWCEFTL